jgi:multidrug efflux pump subunit AcrA (membrane-fusion protein)/beta-lactamase regulating signal transducer with metallopeptidase domain
MNALEFVAQWAIRSSVLIAAGALVLTVLRVKDSSIRLAAWVALLCGSLAIPLMTITLPRVPVIVSRDVAHSVAAPVADFASAPAVAPLPTPPRPFDWMRAAFILYAAVGLGMLLRLIIGLAMSRRLLRESRATAEPGIHESEEVHGPVTLGIWRPVIVLPLDWREWDRAKLDAVLTHERSHIARFDPAVQVLSAVHRAALWFTPASWFLHSRIVRVAEEASDDAATAITRDRTSYAELLLEFMQRGVSSAGVPMARYGRMDTRIRRILNSSVLSRGLTWRSVAAIVALGSPLAYVVAMANPQGAAAPVPKAMAVAQAPGPAQPAARGPAPAVKMPQRNAGYLSGLGTVTAVTVTVSPRIEGQLMSVSFKEGEAVQAGQVIANVESQALKAQVEAAQLQVTRDTNRSERAQSSPDLRKQIDAELAVDQQHLEDVEEQFDAARHVATPIAGVAGLRMVDAGNMVHPGEGIVTIAQMQPITVLFTLPADFVSKVRSRMGGGAGPTVEVWNRDSSAKMATGHLTAIDNQIDEKTGTVKLKATFDNKDSALFPNQFVNVRLLVQ